MDDLSSLKNFFDEFNKEVTKFEQFCQTTVWKESGALECAICQVFCGSSCTKNVIKTLFSKKEQDELKKKLLAKEAELAEKSARLAAAEKRSAELEKENLELRKKVAELSKLEKSQAENRNAAPAGKQEVNDEVMVLERAQPLLTSNETNANTAELITLRAENERLQHKNEELRKRNFKIVEDVLAGLEKQLSCQVSPSSNKSPESEEENGDSSRKQLLEERELVASAIGSLVNTPLKDSQLRCEFCGSTNLYKPSWTRAKNHFYLRVRCKDCQHHTPLVTTSCRPG